MPEDTIVPQSQYTGTEQKIMAIWKDVLSVSTLSIHDHFVDLGGDSLAAMLCISRLRDAFGVEFGIDEFFWDHATIAEFSAAIDQSRGAADAS